MLKRACVDFIVWRLLFLTDCWQMDVFLCFAVVLCYRPPWLILIKPRRAYFIGKRTGDSNLVSCCSGSYFHEHLFISRVISSLQRQLVMADFTPEFRQKIQDFYRRFSFPIELKNFRNRYVFVCQRNSFSISVPLLTRVKPLWLLLLYYLIYGNLIIPSEEIHVVVHVWCPTYTCRQATNTHITNTLYKKNNIRANTNNNRQSTS